MWRYSAIRHNLNYRRPLKGNYISQLKGLLALALSAMLLTGTGVYAAPKGQKPADPEFELAIFYSSATVNLKLLELIQAQYRKRVADVTFKLIDTDQASRQDFKQQLAESRRCAVTLGLSSLQKALSVRAKTPLFSIQVSQAELDRLVHTYRRLNVDISGIYEEQPFSRQTLLAKAISPATREVSVLLSQQYKFYLSDYKQAAQRSELALKYFILSPHEKPDHYFTQQESSPANLLMINDSNLFSQANLAALVTSAYQKKARIIGSKMEDAKNGALAAVYTPAEALAAQSSEMIYALCIKGKQQPLQFANDFSVAINQHIAKNLGLTHLTNRKLTEQMTLLEKQTNPMETGNE